jgi:hypothetical protein
MRHAGSVFVISFGTSVSSQEVLYPIVVDDELTPQHSCFIGEDLYGDFSVERCCQTGFAGYGDPRCFYGTYRYDDPQAPAHNPSEIVEFGYDYAYCCHKDKVFGNPVCWEHSDSFSDWS